MSDSEYYIVDLPTPGTREATRTAASLAHRFIGVGRAETARLTIDGTRAVVERERGNNLPVGVRGLHGPMTAAECRAAIAADIRSWVEAQR